MSATHMITCGALVALLGGCGVPEQTEQQPPEFLGVKTELMDGDLVRFLVSMRRTQDRDQVAKYAECAAAQYTLIRGYGFARHIRTVIDREGDGLRADAAYTISQSLPEGMKTLDAEIVVADCAANGIPAV